MSPNSPRFRSGGAAAPAARPQDVEWNKDGRPVNWDGRDWQLYKRVMMRYLNCYEVGDEEWPLDDICDQTVTEDDILTRNELQTFKKQNRLLGKLISSSLSCNLARQVMNYNYGADMWDYLSKRYEGRENATTTLYTQRTLRQKLEMASCRPGANVENHLLYMISLREQLAALDADVSDVWMVDLMIRSMSQFSYYSQLQTLMLLGGTRTLSTPTEAKAMIITLEKNDLVEKQLRMRRESLFGRGQGEPGGGSGGNRAPPAQEQRGKPQNGGGGPGGQPARNGGGGRPAGGEGAKGANRSEKQEQRRSDFEQRTCFACHQPGHQKKDCPNKSSSSAEHQDGQAHFTVATGFSSLEMPKSKTKQQPGSAGSRVEEPSKYKPECWVFDCAKNRHLVGDKRYFASYRDLTTAEAKNEVVRGHSGESTPVGVGAIDLEVINDGEKVCFRLENVFFSPNHQNLLSQSVAHKQGFDVTFDNERQRYSLFKNGNLVLKTDMHKCGIWLFNATNAFLGDADDGCAPSSMVNFALSDGVADLQCWHDRLGHLCPQFVKKMADNGLVKGMTLRKRQFDMCEACQLGKQRAKSPNKSLDRGVTARNQLVFADLLFPPANFNCTQYKAILVVMDAHTRFLTAYPVKTKNASEINSLLRRYVVWAERQWPQFPVKEVLTDGGGEFENTEITAWYQRHGIIHTVTPPHTSRLNMVERSHQTLFGMLKSMMKESGLPTSFWVDALYYAVYIKNRSYSSAIDGIPYQAMWQRTPDIHHLRKFGALAYVHSKVGADRHKFADNCRVGFVLGYREGQLGCKVYFPTERTVQVAGQVTVNEQILYRHRHDGQVFDSAVETWAGNEYPDITGDGRSDYDLPVVGGRERSQTQSSQKQSPPDENNSEEQHQTRKRPSWVERDVPVFSDEMVFSVADRAGNAIAETQGETEAHDAVNPRPADAVETTVRSANDSSSRGMTTRSMTRRRAGLVPVDERSDERELSNDEFAVFAALAFVVGQDMQQEQKRWHASEVTVPKTFREAMSSPQRSEWWKGMEKEMAAMDAKDVFEIVHESEIPENKKALETMWHFQLKTDSLGNVLRFRPRLCARGDKQVPEIDFRAEEIFSPVASMASFRLFVALCELLQLDEYQGDVDTAYLSAKLQIVHFIRKIAGFPLTDGWVRKVKHALYGLHQSGKEWNDELNSWLLSKGWQKNSTEPCLYTYFEGGVKAILLVYVDDIICGTNSKVWKENFFSDLNERYGFKDQGRLNNYLGIQVESDASGVFMHQAKYAGEVLKRFGFDDARGCRSPMEPNLKLRVDDENDKEPGIDYRAVIGSLMYLATSTRPDLAYSVGYLSRFCENPSRAHGAAVKRVLQYLAATKNQGIFFRRGQQDDAEAGKAIKIDGYCDADWGNCPDTRKSVTGYVLKVSGGPVAWAARRQSVIAQSTAEAEYVAACEACQEGRAIENVLMDILPEFGLEFSLGVDNQAALALATHPSYSRKTRHIELRYHYVRELSDQGIVQLWKVEGEENPADLFTKAVNHVRSSKLKKLVGMWPGDETTPREDRRSQYAKSMVNSHKQVQFYSEVVDSEGGVLKLKPPSDKSTG